MIEMYEEPRRKYREPLVDIKAIEVRFNEVKLKGDLFILSENGEYIATVSAKFLNDKTISKLRSLAEWDINGRD